MEFRATGIPVGFDWDPALEFYDATVFRQESIYSFSQLFIEIMIPCVNEVRYWYWLI